MNLLAIDTSTAATVVVAQRADGTLAERRHVPEGKERPAHTTLGLALAAEALAELGISWNDLERIGVGTGPGSFTGLRAGLAAAAGLARRLEIPLVGITASEILASAATERAAGRPLLTVIDGRRREVFLQSFMDGVADGPILAWARADLDRELGHLRDWLVVGDGALLEREVFLAHEADVPGPGDSIHELSAAALARLTAAGEPQDADAVRPTYGRDADAVPTAQREAGGA